MWPWFYLPGTDGDCGMVQVPDFDPDSDSDPKPSLSDLVYPIDTQAPLQWGRLLL